MPTNTRLEVFVASRIVQSSFPAMDAAPAMQDALSGLVSRVMDSPYTSFFTICALLCLFTRIWTGYQNFRIQSDTTSSEKNVPIMPYWLPYLGHAPAFALSFDNLIAKGRFVFGPLQPLLLLSAHFR
jgi:TRAP-type C4-dicarboxylate transport system permease small subunit